MKEPDQDLLVRRDAIPHPRTPDRLDVDPENVFQLTFMPGRDLGKPSSPAQDPSPRLEHEGIRPFRAMERGTSIDSFEPSPNWIGPSGALRSHGAQSFHRS